MTEGGPAHATILDFFRGTLAVARLTITESNRQRLWWFVLLAMAGLLLVIPTLNAVDDGARLKLAVAAISGTIGFITTLVAVFVIVIAVRRDLESRCSFMLFSKPLPRLAYCFGRWLGAMGTLALAVLLLSVAGTAAIRLQLGQLPYPQQTMTPVHWQSLDHLGATSEVRDDAQRVILDQRSGAGLRLTFSGLAVDGREQFLLLKAMVSGSSGYSTFSWAPIQAAALAAKDGQPVLLEVAPDSLFGRTDTEGNAIPDGQLALRHRANQRSDLQADYLRLVIPPTALQADGSLRLQILRMGSESGIIFSRENGIMVTTNGSPFIVDLLKAGLVNLAQAGVLAAAALALVIISGVGTSLLGCLTLFFGGHAVGLVGEVSSSSQTSLLAKRIIDLLVPIVPDFGRFPVAAELAAAQSIDASSIIHAWFYFGIWMVALMGFSWFILWRKEL